MDPDMRINVVKAFKEIVGKVSSSSANAALTG
jgi:hypothetical protein